MENLPPLSTCPLFFSGTFCKLSSFFFPLSWLINAPMFQTDTTLTRRTNTTRKSNRRDWQAKAKGPPSPNIVPFSVPLCRTAARSQSRGAASRPCSRSFTRSTSSAPSAWSNWTRAPSSSRMTSRTATPASSSSSADLPPCTPRANVVFCGTVSHHLIP